MFFNVFPIPTVLFQFLFLLVAISIEGLVLHRLLKLSRRTSIEYSASINLLTTFLGWLLFFSVLPLLPKVWEGHLISYIFFDRLITTQLQSAYTMIIFTLFTIFLSAFLIKLIGLKFLQILLEDVPKDTKPSVQQPFRRYRGLLNRNDHQDFLPPKPNQAVALLVANACSYSALLLLLVLRFVQVHIYNSPS